MHFHGSSSSIGFLPFLSTASRRFNCISRESVRRSTCRMIAIICYRERSIYAYVCPAQSLMTQMPWLREAMLIMSLVLAVAIAYQISLPNRPTAMRVTGMLSLIFTLGLAGWSVLHFGL